MFIHIFTGRRCETDSIVRAKRLLLAGGLLQCLSCFVLDLSYLFLYTLDYYMDGSFEVVSSVPLLAYSAGFLFMADVVVTSAAVPMAAWREENSALLPHLTYSAGFSYILAVFFWCFAWLIIQQQGGDEWMLELLIESMYWFARIFTWAAIISAAAAIITSFRRDREKACAAAGQTLISCGFFALILWFLTWLIL